ncbi:MAG: UDP-N-acetylmuramate dehydrogenase [Mariprofundaceae bacterium]
MSLQSWEITITNLGRLRSSEPMSKHTTLGVGGPARWFFRPSGRDALIKALPLIPADIPVFPLGRGSNLLFSDAGFAGLILDLGSLTSIKKLDCQSVQALAGARMSKMAMFCADHELEGAEFMATVPGDVGGGIAMNAGAFGQQVSNTLHHVELIHRQGQIEILSSGQLNMGYRRCHLPAGSTILGGRFRLSAGKAEDIRQRMRSMRERRSRSQPLAQPNCGSVFKNPLETYAATLLEQAGLKGTGVGKARFSEKHANFIVNEGGATSSDILALIKRAQETVEQLFSIRLEPEVRIVGKEP